MSEILINSGFFQDLAAKLLGIDIEKTTFVDPFHEPLETDFYLKCDIDVSKIEGLSNLKEKLGNKT